MKSLTEHLWFEVKGRRGFVNITDTVEELVLRSGVNEGLCLCNAMHITASVFINDNESGLHHDYEVWLEKLAPHAPTSQYHRNRTGEDNADAHSNARSWAAKSWSPSPKANSTLARENKFSTANSTAIAGSAFFLKSLVINR